MKVEHLFSSPIYINTLKTKDQKLVSKLIPILEDDFYESEDKNKNAGHWNCLSYQTYLFGHGQETFNDSLYTYIDEYLHELGFYSFKYEINGWFNLYQENQFQEAHDHIPQLFSGMVVMQYDKDTHLPTEFLNFHNRDQAININHYVDMGYLKKPTNMNIANEYLKLTSMENNKIFIWSGSQVHRVPVQPKSEKLRITYTFNVTPTHP